MLTKLYANGAAFLHTLKKDQRGVTAIEYAVVAVAISTLVAALFSGEKTYSFDGGISTDSRMLIVEDDPAPFTLLAMAPEVDVKPTR